MMISVFLNKQREAILRGLAAEMETSLSIAIQVIVETYLDNRDE